MKALILLIFILSSSFCFGQKDTIFKMDAYTVLYSVKLKAPLYAKTKIYHGGGNCNRNKFRFHKVSNITANDDDYDSRYDKGHIVPAEMYAFDCRLDEQTFRYFNCFPQTPNLNRGIWQKVEITVVAMSQKDSLIVIAGGLYGSNKIGNNVSVPDTCWKIVYSLSKRKIIISKIFTNTKDSKMSDISFTTLRKIILSRYRIDLKKLLK